MSIVWRFQEEEDPLRDGWKLSCGTVVSSYLLGEPSHIRLTYSNNCQMFNRFMGGGLL